MVVHHGFYGAKKNTQLKHGPTYCYYSHPRAKENTWVMQHARAHMLTHIHTYIHAHKDTYTGNRPDHSFKEVNTAILPEADWIPQETRCMRQERRLANPATILILHSRVSLITLTTVSIWGQHSKE